VLPGQDVPKIVPIFAHGLRMVLRIVKILISLLCWTKGFEVGAWSPSGDIQQNANSLRLWCAVDFTGPELLQRPLMECRLSVFIAISAVFTGPVVLKMLPADCKVITFIASSISVHRFGVISNASRSANELFRLSFPYVFTTKGT